MNEYLSLLELPRQIQNSHILHYYGVLLVLHPWVYGVYQSDFSTLDTQDDFVHLKAAQILTIFFRRASHHSGLNLDLSRMATAQKQHHYSISNFSHFSLAWLLSYKGRCPTNVMLLSSVSRRSLRDENVANLCGPSQESHSGLSVFESKLRTYFLAPVWLTSSSIS